MTPEGKVKKAIKDILNKHGVWYCCPRGTALGASGVPDFLCCAGGVFLAIEAKAGKNKPTALQAYTILRIRKCGGLAFVINEDNMSELDRTLADLSVVYSEVYDDSGE